MVMVSIHALKRLVTVFRFILWSPKLSTEQALTAGQQGTRIVHFNGSLLVSKNFSSRAFKAVRGGLCQARPGIIDRFTFQPAAFYRHAFKPQLRARRRDEQKSVDVTESECQCLVRTSITILTTTAEHKQSFYCSHNARPEAQIDDNKCTRGIGQPTYLHHSSLTCVHWTWLLNTHFIKVSVN